MYRYKALIFMAIFSMAIPAVQAKVTPPSMSMKDQTVHPDPFIRTLRSVCREKHPQDVERCVRFLRNLEKLGAERKRRGGCGYLILEGMGGTRPCF